MFCTTPPHPLLSLVESHSNSPPLANQTLDGVIHKIWELILESNDHEALCIETLHAAVCKVAKISSPSQSLRSVSQWKRLYSTIHKNAVLCLVFAALPHIIRNASETDASILCLYNILLSFLPQKKFNQRLAQFYSLSDPELAREMWMQKYSYLMLSTLGEYPFSELTVHIVSNFIASLSSVNERKIRVAAKWLVALQSLDDQAPDHSQDHITSLMEHLVALRDDSARVELIQRLHPVITADEKVLQSAHTALKELIGDDTLTPKERCHALNLLDAFTTEERSIASVCFKIMQYESLFQLRVSAVEILSSYLSIQESCDDKLRGTMIKKVLHSGNCDPNAKVRRVCLECLFDVHATLHRDKLHSTLWFELILNKGQDKDQKIRQRAIEWLRDNFSDVPRASTIAFTLIHALRPPKEKRWDVLKPLFDDLMRISLAKQDTVLDALQKLNVNELKEFEEVLTEEAPLPQLDLIESENSGGSVLNSAQRQASSSYIEEEDMSILYETL